MIKSDNARSCDLFGVDNLHITSLGKATSKEVIHCRGDRDRKETCSTRRKKKREACRPWMIWYLYLLGLETNFFPPFLKSHQLWALLTITIYRHCATPYQDFPATHVHIFLSWSNFLCTLVQEVEKNKK